MIIIIDSIHKYKEVSYASYKGVEKSSFPVKQEGEEERAEEDSFLLLALPLVLLVFVV